MAKILDDFNWSTVKGGAGRTPKYPLEEWCDGQTRQLVWDEDFKCKPATLRSLLSHHARKRGLRIRTALLPDGSIILKAELKAKR